MKKFNDSTSIIMEHDCYNKFYYCKGIDDIEQTIQAIFNESIISVDETSIYTNNHELPYMLLNEIGVQVLYDVSPNRDTSKLDSQLLGQIMHSECKDIYSK
jgi:hypothetical protein